MTTSKRAPLSFYKQRKRDWKGPVAVVRYTMYAEDGLVHAVDHIEYGDTKEERNSMQDQVISSLECDVEVAIMTAKDITDFPTLCKFLDR